MTLPPAEVVQVHTAMHDRQFPSGTPRAIIVSRRTPMSCTCAERGYVRSLEEDDWGLPARLEALAETPTAWLGRCRACGTWWERLPHYVYGYAWYRAEPSFFSPDADAALAAWRARREAVTA
jgi:hypothetical protein